MLRYNLIYLRPAQHGQDLVGLISTMINENAHKQSRLNNVLTCLALESLQALVAAEVRAYLRRKVIETIFLKQILGFAIVSYT